MPSQALTADSRFKALKQGDHVCAVYATPEEQADAMVAYIGRGLDAGERCLYIVDDRSAQEVLQRMSKADIDVGSALASRRLQLATSRDTYLRNGTFDPDAMIGLLADSEQQALSEGCRGLRITGEMTWALGSDVWSQRVMDYETKLNRFFPESRSHAICQYNSTRFSPSVIRDVLKTHPIALIGQYACPNPYYEPPNLISQDDGGASYVEWMIEHMLEARKHELALQESIRERDHFLSVASHEIRTPLHSLGLSLEMLKQLGGKADANVLARAQRQLARLNMLVGTLLDVSQINERRLTLNTTRVDLRAVASEVAASFAQEAASAGCAIGLEGEAVVGTWDEHRLEQVIANLLGNAIKYGAGRPVRIAITTKSERARLSVTDEGIGIDEDQQARIFERFSRASSSRHFAGLGLGLWISRSLVEAMGGRILLESAPGKGSTFSVELPMAEVHDKRS